MQNALLFKQATSFNQCSYHMAQTLYRFFSRKKPMGLIVALGDEGQASGQLFWDDGESIGQLLSYASYYCELFLNSLNL